MIFRNIYIYIYNQVQVHGIDFEHIGDSMDDKAKSNSRIAYLFFSRTDIYLSLESCKEDQHILIALMKATTLLESHQIHEIIKDGMKVNDRTCLPTKSSTLKYLKVVWMEIGTQ